MKYLLKLVELLLSLVLFMIKGSLNSILLIYIPKLRQENHLQINKILLSKSVLDPLITQEVMFSFFLHFVVGHLNIFELLSTQNVWWLQQHLHFTYVQILHAILTGFAGTVEAPLGILTRSERVLSGAPNSTNHPLLLNLLFHLVLLDDSDIK